MTLDGRTARAVRRPREPSDCPLMAIDWIPHQVRRPREPSDCPLMAIDWIPHQVRRQRDQLREPGQKGE